MSCNPAKNWVYADFFKPFKENKLPPTKAFVQALAKDNPHNPKTYIESLKNLQDKVLKERLWFGNWEYEDDELSLFKIDDIHDLFTNTVDKSDMMFITCDVARMGRDLTVIMVWKGLECVDITTYDKTTITEVCELIKKKEIQFKVPRSHTLADEDGVGGGVVDNLKCRGFVGNSSQIEDRQREFDSAYKVNYQNLRSQCFYILGELVQTSKMRINTENSEYKEKIIEDLEQIKAKDVDKDGRLRIISKEDIKEYIGRSTDFADCLMMRMLYEVDGPRDLTIRTVG